MGGRELGGQRGRREEQHYRGWQMESKLGITLIHWRERELTRDEVRAALVAAIERLDALPADASAADVEAALKVAAHTEGLAERHLKLEPPSEDDIY